MNETLLLEPTDGPPYEVHNLYGKSKIVFVCEHASNCIPKRLNNLGLTADQLNSHVAWDPGARALAKLLSDRFDAPLVEARFSRLVYDCNRPPSAPSAMPAKTEAYLVPGNSAISEVERAARAEQIYEPFHTAVTEVLNSKKERGEHPILVTIHSFTPVFHGISREVEIGILHNSEDQLSTAILSSLEGSHFMCRSNDPYGPEDGVLHSIEKHQSHGAIPYAMIEVRNDLLKDVAGTTKVFEQLTQSLSQAVSSLPSSISPNDTDIPNA